MVQAVDLTLHISSTINHVDTMNLVRAMVVYVLPHRPTTQHVTKLHASTDTKLRYTRLDILPHGDLFHVSVDERRCSRVCLLPIEEGRDVCPACKAYSISLLHERRDSPPSLAEHPTYSIVDTDDEYTM
jgi:hypothetical protein